MEIKILGPGCKKCTEAEQIVKETVAENNIDADIVKVTDIKEIAKHGVMATPTVVIDGKPKIVGKVPTKADLLKHLQ